MLIEKATDLSYGNNSAAAAAAVDTNDTLTLYIRGPEQSSGEEQ